jgi:serine/threonine-protein kinase RsbW
MGAVLRWRRGFAIDCLHREPEAESSAGGVGSWNGHGDRLILPDSTTNQVSLVLDSALESVETIEQTAETYALQAGFDEDTASQIAMVSREAGVNAVLHGNKQDPNKRVTATFEVTEDALKIQIADEGPGLDPETLPDPLAPENILKPSGRGVFLMRAIMDEVEFRKLAPGTEITMVKHRLQKEKDA